MKRKQDAQAILDKPVEDVQAQIVEYTEAKVKFTFSGLHPMLMLYSERCR